MEKCSHKTRLRFIHIIVVVCALGVLHSPSWGQPRYPTKPVQIINSMAAGGQSDIVNRLLAEYLKNKLGQPFVAVSITGGAGVPAATAIANATPDGYTIGTMGESTMLLGLLMKTPVQPSDFKAIANFYAIHNCVIVNSETPWKTMKELIDYAKTHPGLKTAMNGKSSATWWRMMLLNKEAGIELEGVPFTGDAENTAAVLGKHVDLGITGYTTPKAQERAGKIRFLMTFTPDGIEGEPHIPTLSQVLGRQIKNFPPIAPLWAPAKTPDYIISILSKAVKEITMDPSYQEKMKELGVPVKYMDENELNAYRLSTIELFRRAIETEKK